MEAILGGPIDIIFFCLAFSMYGIFQYAGSALIKNTPEANIMLLKGFSSVAYVGVLVIGLVCSVHIAKSG